MSRRLVPSFAALWALSGCSLQTFDRQSCTASTECAAAFGFGWSCAADGYCHEETLHPRCEAFPDDLFTDKAGHSDDIVFGGIFDLSETSFEFMVRAARLAVLQANEHEGLESRPFALVTCTNEVDPTRDDLDGESSIETVGTWLSANIGVRGIVGPVRSGEAEVAYNTLAPLDTLMVTPSATSPALTALDGLSASDEQPGLLWRTVPPDDLQGAVIAIEMVEVLGAERVAVVHQTGAYGEGLAEVFVDNFAAAGGSSELFPFTTVTELGAAVPLVADGAFDHVLMISSNNSDIIGFLNAAGGSDAFDDLGIFLTDGAFDAQILKEAEGAAGHLFPNIRGTVPRPSIGETHYETFAAQYRVVYDGQDPAEFGFTAQAYDAAWLLIYGSAWATYQEGGAIGGRTMARGLRHLSAGTPLDVGPSSWNLARATFREGDPFDAYGASGHLDFDPVTEETTAPMNVWTINGAGDGFDVEYCVDLSDAPNPACCTRTDDSCRP